jgi:ribokinase
VVVTLGSHGAELRTADGAWQHVDSFAVDPVDTTAAGDAFCGALAAALSRGAELIDALRFANAAGALATTRHGAVPSLAQRVDIESLVAR